MRYAMLAVIAVMLLASGCLKPRPLTESEFKGFCYQYQPTPEFDCDTISVCNDYGPVLEKEHASCEECIKGCRAVYLRQMQGRTINDCPGAFNYGEDWCERFCRTNYPK